MWTAEEIKKLPYTLKEIVEFDYPKIWDLAQNCTQMLHGWQEMLVEPMQVFHENLPADVEARTSENTQITFLNYLKLRSLYGLAYEIWEQVNHWCHKLGVSGNELDEEGVNKAKAVLTDLFKAFGKVDAVDIAHDNVNGFQKLEQAVDGFGTFHEFIVMPIYHNDVQRGNWGFRDIIGNIAAHGLQNDALWESALRDTVPTAPNIGGLMESEEDNKLIRMY